MDAIPHKALDQHLVVLGKTGSGKSSALRYIVEHYLLSKDKRVCIVDPKGDWWGVKVAADGKSPGLPVILFGDFKNPDARDVPINDRSGKHIAELVSEGNRPCVIGLRGWTQGAMTRFWIDFASTLFGKNAGELYLIADEFHNFAPKGKILSPEAGQSLHWSNRLLSEGRGLGIVCLTASQRPQKVHNDSLTSHETLVAMRVIHKADRDAIKDWIDGNGDPTLGKEVLTTLAGLPRGEAWVWSPEIGFGPKRVKFPMFQTFDSFAPPQLQKRVSDKGWASVDLSEVKNALAEAVREAEANDPKLLRAEIAKLKKQLSGNPSAAPATDPKAIERAVAAAVTARDWDWQRAIKERDGMIGTLKGRMGKAAAILNVNGEAEPKVNFQPQSIPTAIPRSAPPERGVAAGNNLRTSPQAQRGTGVATRPAKQPVKHDENYSAVDTPLGKAERSILTALYWLRGEDVTPAKVGFYANYTVEGGSFKNAIGRLRTLGLVRNWALTAEGETAAEEIVTEDKPTGPELRDWLGKKLGAAENKLLDALCEAYPQRLTDEELGQASGYEHTGGSYKNAIGRLRTLEAAEGYARDGGTKAADVFFE
jgi:hypothetical protein